MMIRNTDEGVGSLFALVLHRNPWIVWDASNAFLARTSVEGPGMRMFRDGDPAECLAIVAGINEHISKASCSRLERAAIMDLIDPGAVIELEVPPLVESSIADRWRRRSARDACRHLVVNVEVLSATFFLLTSSSTTMPCENLVSVVITLEVTVSKEELAHLFAELVAIDNHSILHAHNGRPDTVMVNLEADGVAVLVVCFTSLIDASLTAALGEELFLGVVVEENVNVAFDLLRS
jgi:hypothetical protein